MRSVIVGTAGHVDHGKTALVRALTGVDTDRWEEERRRGITIDLGFAPLPLDEVDVEASVVDVPGHEDFVKNMLAGATGIDVLMLVVAADEGPMPQTTEHLWIARYLGVETGVVAITKADLVESDWIDLVVQSTRDEVSRVMGRDDWPVVPTSATTGDGIRPLRRAIAATVRSVRPNVNDDLFRMPIDRSFTVRGVGTVVTGTVWSGRVEVADNVHVMPRGRTFRVRAIQVHGMDATGAGPAQRAAVALVGAERDAVARGDVLCDDPVWRSTRFLDVRVEACPDAERSLHHWQRLRLHLGTAETMARLVLYEGDAVAPGGSAYAQLRLDRPVVARCGDRFVIRFYSPVTTIGGGVVLDPWAPRRGRGHGAAVPRLRQLASTAAADRVEACVAGSGSGFTVLELAVMTGEGPSELEALLPSLEAETRVWRMGARWYSGRALARAREEVLQALRNGHARDSSAPGVDLGELRTRLALPEEVVDAALGRLDAEGEIRIEGSLAALAQHTPRLDPGQQELAGAALAAIREGGLGPPQVPDLAVQLGVETAELLTVLRFLTRQGTVVSVTADLYLEREALDAARARLTERLRRGPAAAGELREELGTSRRYAIPLLEHFDAMGLTRRTPAGRVLRDAE